MPRLFGSPAFDLGPKPELQSAFAEVDNRARHVGVTTLVLADGVAVGQAQEVRNGLGVEKVFGRNQRSHVAILQL